MSLQVEQNAGKPAASSPDMMQPHPQVEGEHQTCLATDGFLLDSSETSILSPSSLSDCDMLEAALDGSSSLVSEKLIPEEPADISVNVQIKESHLTNTDINVTQTTKSSITEDGKDGTCSKTSLLTESVGQESSQKLQECTVTRTSDQDEVMSHKVLDPNSNVTTLCENIEGCDVPDGLKSEDLPSVSEAVPPSLKPEPKKQLSLFKRNKKKSNQGNLSINLNKDDLWNASLLVCLKAKFVLFALYLAFYILCMSYFSTCL